MAGIYIHVPFCKQACHYCNFYFSTSLHLKSDIVDAIKTEIARSKNYLQNERISTIYFGGGTPSLLSVDELKSIIETIHQHHNCAIEELTLEANPDDLTMAKIAALAELKAYGLNRLSIGVQSFFEDDLRYMNRAHNSAEAIASIKSVQDAGFDLLTIDLIYGTPTMHHEQWSNNIDTAVALGIPHISAYALTVEEKTALHKKIKKQQLQAVSDQHTSEQFDILTAALGSFKYDHYEISNFALPGKNAIHNTNYWKGIPYIGLGPSAHSFNGSERRWNVSNNINYIKGIERGSAYYETEQLSVAEQANEYIMTSLRTMWGMDLNHKSIVDYKKEIVQSLGGINGLYYQIENEIVVLTKTGKHFADGIAATLFIEPDDNRTTT